MIEQIDYQYDAAGQRIAKTTLNGNGTGSQDTPMRASFDAANRMRSITFTGTSASTGSSDISYSLSYDQNGNLTQKQNQLEPNDKTTYSWDANNRLIQMNQSKTISNNIGTGSAGTTGTSTSTSSTTALSASFSYDAFGRRIQSTITQGSQAPTTVQYLYEGAQALGEIRDGKLSHRLLTGLSLDETIARIAINADGNKDAANSRLYLTDALNSVIAQLADDDNANIQNSYGYSPYGQSQTVGPDSANNPNQYTSRENDNTGLYYYRARYYDPVMKRFVSSDPIGLAGGMNTYAYVEGDPLSYTDPSGLKTMQCLKPLNALKEKLGSGFSTFARDWIPAAHHQYSCVISKNGKVTCGGQDHAASPLRGPGKPSEDTLEAGQCKEVEPDNDNFQKCVMNEWKKPRPTYGIPFGTDCQEYDDAIIKQCRSKFPKK